MTIRFLKFARFRFLFAIIAIIGVRTFSLFGAVDRSEFLHRNSRITLSKISRSSSFRGTKIPNPVRHSVWGAAAGLLRSLALSRHPLRNLFVRTKLGQLEVPEALRTARLSASPRFQRGGQSSGPFRIVNGFFQIPSIFCFAPATRFYRAGEHLSVPVWGVNRFFEFSVSPPHRCFQRPAAFGCGAVKLA